jgi:hypothetical protein
MIDMASVRMAQMILKAEVGSDFPHSSLEGVDL